ncbi:hypothetical protein [Phenylobacterium sp.]|jgi:hypothetical protein|uniref:hypothetical protein n=1 Tax=Phenylobacterium sp. TaxID=1871053 RepID=UPI002E373C77|nr:hypothetical protein [Phenylobacterium sp.]HEX3365500.1 hypothetical protein [Phenylobacterium sp.]
MIGAVFAAAVLLMQAAPATAPPAPSATPAASASVSPLTVTGRKQQSGDLDPNQVLCHSEPKLGSLFPTKVCATRRETDERRRNDQEQARDFQRSIIVGKQAQ